MPNTLITALRLFVQVPFRIFIWMIWFFKWMIAPFALPIQLLLGVPLAMSREERPLRPHFTPIAESDLPDAVWVSFADTHDALALDGFIQGGDFRGENLLEQGEKTVWLRLLLQPEQGIAAWVTHTEDHLFRHTSPHGLELSTFFDNDRVIVTHNLNKPPHFPTPRFLARLQLTEVCDPRALYILHRDTVLALAQPVNLLPIQHAINNAIIFLTECATYEITALLKEGWLRMDALNPEIARLSLWGAMVYVWHRAWPLSDVHLRAMDRKTRLLLKDYGIAVEAFTGAAASIVVDQHPLPTADDAAVMTTVTSGYQHVRALARHIDPSATLEAVSVELTKGLQVIPAPREFRYSFWCQDDAPSRRIRRRRRFDVLLDPVARILAVTAMLRDYEQAVDADDWDALISTPTHPALRPGPWLYDLDVVLPLARQVQKATVKNQYTHLDWASLYMDEDGLLYWQITICTPTGTPLQKNVLINARTGRVFEE